VVCLWEHVDGRDACQTIAEIAELGAVAGQGRRVARDVDEALGVQRGGALQRLARHAGPRWVGDDDGGRRGVRRSERLLEQSAHVAGAEVDVGDRVPARVRARRGDRLLLDLDRVHLRGPPRQRQ